MDQRRAFSSSFRRPEYEILEVLVPGFDSALGKNSVSANRNEESFKSLDLL